MNCREFWNTMPELTSALDRSGHLEECPACAAEWKRQRALADGLRAVQKEWRHLQAPARVESRLTAAFRANNGLAARRPRWTWVPALTWAAAAISMAVISLFLVRGRQPLTPHRPAPAGVEMALVQPASTIAAADDSPYADSDFIPLPNAERIAPNEEVNVVRVEVPRSAMMALGLEVSADQASEPVEAEVVLGSDGLARAVRFLE